MFKRVEPTASLDRLIECYWFVDEPDPTPRTQKIIPDGYPEIILHYGAPYRINIDDNWRTQAPFLFAGQIRNHFYLENTGASRIVGIKLWPTAPTRLFGTNMRSTVDAVVDLDVVAGGRLASLGQSMDRLSSVDERVSALDAFWSEQKPHLKPGNELAEDAVSRILSSHGSVRIAELADELGSSERHLQRLFARHVGLSPKRFARVIRFGRIFELVQRGKPNWSELALDSGHYDQAHFIRNFQEFTGEHPSGYGFDDENLANFFLNKNTGPKRGK